MRLLTALMLAGLPALCLWVSPSQAQPETIGFSTHVLFDHGPKPGTFQIRTSIVELETGQVIAKAFLILEPGKPSAAESVDPASKTTMKLDAKVTKPVKSAEYNLSIAKFDRIVAKHSGVVALSSDKIP